MKSLNSWMLIAAILTASILVACGGSDFDVDPDTTDAGDVEAGPESGAESGSPDAAVPPTGVAACVAWENGPQPLSAVAACPLDDTCAEWTREFWQKSCEDDCASLAVDQVQCLCECMVNATPWDGAISEPCQVDYEDLYDCWMAQ